MRYDLVFEGGGAKGMVFVGAIQALEAQGYSVARLLGTSAGAISACLLAAGYTADEMLAALDEKSNGKPVFAGFLGAPVPVSDASVEASTLVQLMRKVDLPFVSETAEQRIGTAIVRWMASHDTLRHLFSFIELGGWYSADPFVEWITARLNFGTVAGAPRRYGSMTLGEFYAATEKDASFVASDTTGGNMLILNHRTAPGVPVAWAVRMSMGIPLLWQEVTWKNEWGAYRGTDITGHTVVDGGLLSNFPIELLASRDPNVMALMGEQAGGALLGFLIDEDAEVPGAPPPPPAKASRFAQIPAVTRMSNLLNTMLEARDRRVIEALANMVVRLPAKDYGTAEFDITDARKDCLIQSGRAVTARYLESRVAHRSFSGTEEEEPMSPRARAAATQCAAKILGF